MELETINKLYLELSQITTATTAREILLQKQLAEAQREAVSLAESLFNKHYAHEPDYASGKVQWEPFNEPASVISQIDNMVAGISDQLAEAQRELNIQRCKYGRVISVDDFIVTFRCEDKGAVGKTGAKIHSISQHDDGVIEIMIDHWP